MGGAPSVRKLNPQLPVSNAWRLKILTAKAMAAMTDIHMIAKSRFLIIHPSRGQPMFREGYLCFMYFRY
jgi:hypothetical protein